MIKGAMYHGICVKNGSLRQKVTAALLVVIIVTAPLILTGCGFTPGCTKRRESAMARVLRTGKIRCGYLIYSPYFRKDPNTGKLSGIFHDLMEEIARNSHLKVEWTEEVGYENIFPGLEANRYDVFAGGLWPNASRARVASFTLPVFYSAITAWGRPGDHRFKNDLSVINSPDVRIATIDGAMEDIIAKSDYPNAQRISLPELSPFSQNLLNVADNKADVTFAEPMVVREFLATNPGTLKQIGSDKPVRVFGNSLVVRRGEADFKEFLDIALQEIIGSGETEKILANYKIAPGTFYPVTHAYQLPVR
jgi:polar amino acid transport system substrate-binding protein